MIKIYIIKLLPLLFAMLVAGVCFCQDTIYSNIADTVGTQVTNKEPQKSRITPGVPSEFDWISLHDGRELEVEVRRISETFVFYSDLGTMDIQWVDRREVRTIFYRTGKIEHLTERAVEIKEVKDWQEVKITRNPLDVEGMIKIDDLEVKQKATTRHHYYKPATLEASAEIILRRQAGNMGADIILVVKVEQHRAYGDPPEVYMSAEAYRER